MPSTPTSSQRRALIWTIRRWFLPVVTLLSLAALISLKGDGLLTIIQPSEPSLTWLLVALGFYALLLTIPFMPSVEIGWLIMAMFGLPGIIGAWVATWVGLMGGFFAGRLFRKSAWYRHRLKALTDSFNKQQSQPGPNMLSRAVRLSRQRPVGFVAIALNVPGNWVLGGGGGIALLASLVLSMKWWQFLLVVIPATGVVPMLLMLGLMPASAL